MSETTLRTIGILLFDGVEELDAVGPWEVLAWWTLNHPEDGYEVVTFSDEGGVVTAAKGLQLVAQDSKASVPALDVLVYPGGRGTRPAERRGPARVGPRAAGAVPLMTSVCTGALVYAPRACSPGGRPPRTGVPGPAARARARPRRCGTRPLRRRRRPRHRIRGLAGDRHGAAPRRPARRPRARAGGPAGDPVRPRAARVTCRPGPAPRRRAGCMRMCRTTRCWAGSRVRAARLHAHGMGGRRGGTARTRRRRWSGVRPPLGADGLTPMKQTALGRSG